MSFFIFLLHVLCELAACILMLSTAIRCFRTGDPGKIGYMAALMGSAVTVEALYYVLLFAGIPYIPQTFSLMLTALCMTFFFLLVFQEGAKNTPSRILPIIADAFAGIRMLMCISSVNNWTGTASVPFWDAIRTALLFLLALTAVAVWFLNRDTCKISWLLIALVLIFSIVPDLYTPLLSQWPLLLLQALSRLSSGVLVWHLHRQTKLKNR